MRLSFLFFIFFTFLAKGASAPRFRLFEDKNCQLTKNYQFLSKVEKRSLEEKIKKKLSSQVIRKFDVLCEGETSHAFILNDRVRTHYQTLLIWLKQNTVKGIEVLEFDEPIKYRAPKNWMETVNGKSLHSLHEVDALSGATLTRQSTLFLLKKALSIRP